MSFNIFQSTHVGLTHKGIGSISERRELISVFSVTVTNE